MEFKERKRWVFLGLPFTFTTYTVKEDLVTLSLIHIFWTGLKSFQRRQMKLEGRSSIWMFPIYGMAAFLAPIARLLRKKCFWVRGAVYTCAIFLTEYLTGSFLKKRDMCPWDYSRARFNIHGIIRLDYAPVWFLTGLLYERILYGRALTQQTAPESLPKN